MLSAIDTGEMPVGETHFYVADHIHIYTEFTCSVPQLSAGSHRLQYRWYTGDKLVLQFSGQRTFNRAPFLSSAWVSGSHFGVGHHRGETWADGTLVDSYQFDVLPGERTQPLPAPDEGRVRESLQDQGRTLVLNGAGEQFDKDAADFRASDKRTPAGISKLAMLYMGASSPRFEKPDDPGWKQLMKFQLNWMERKPVSSAAVITTAEILLAQAWAYRGDGYIDSVDPKAVPMYEQYVEQARQVLEAHPEVAALDPEWDSARIEVAKNQSAGTELIHQMASAAMQRNCCYYPMHFAALTALEPKWGGSQKAVHDYVLEATDRSSKKEGLQLYGRLYLRLAIEAHRPEQELAEYGINWATLREAYKQILAAYPDERNRVAAHAMYCIGGQAEAYAGLGPLSDESAPIAWWDTRDFRESCEARFGTKPVNFWQRLRYNFNSVTHSLREAAGLT